MYFKHTIRYFFWLLLELLCTAVILYSRGEREREREREYCRQGNIVVGCWEEKVKIPLYETVFFFLLPPSFSTLLLLLSFLYNGIFLNKQKIY